MKTKMAIIILCITMLVCLSACDNEPRSIKQTDFPTLSFEAYSTIIETQEDVCILHLTDSRNFRDWVNSCPIEGTSMVDISENWTYRIIFCSDDNVLYDNGVYYIPHTATTHVVYINEELGVIQCADSAYLIKMSVGDAVTFYDGICEYFDAALASKNAAS